MPKVKTNSGAKKRFTFTGTGKIKRKHAYKSHILTKKTKKQKRNLTRVSIVDVDNLKAVRQLLVKSHTRRKARLSLLIHRDFYHFFY